MQYDHYLALDWAERNMALAHVTRQSTEIETIDVVADIKALKEYIGQIKGTKVLTFEESGPAQWLYTELICCVDEIIVCEPYNNHLLKTGPKNDRIDAIKLLRLLRANMLKPVFHCTDEFVRVRKIVSAHEDLIKAVVQLKNQRKALFRATGKKVGMTLDSAEEQFVLNEMDELISVHEKVRLKYERQYRRICRENEVAKNLTSIPGIGFISATKIAAIVVEPRRFSHKTAFWLYCGLQKYDLISGGRSYGKRSPRYCRRLKSVFKTAALVCLRSEESNPLRQYYETLIKMGYPEHQARHALARRLATLALGVMKRAKPLDFDELREKQIAS